MPDRGLRALRARDHSRANSSLRFARRLARTSPEPPTRWLSRSAAEAVPARKALAAREEFAAPAAVPAPSPRFPADPSWGCRDVRRGPADRDPPRPPSNSHLCPSRTAPASPSGTCARATTGLAASSGFVPQPANASIRTRSPVLIARSRPPGPPAPSGTPPPPRTGSTGPASTAAAPRPRPAPTPLPPRIAPG
jgi:hypothetical protein